MKKTQTKSIKRYEKPSLFKKNKLAEARAKLIEMIQGQYVVSKKEAEEYIENDEAWERLLKFEDKYWSIKGFRELMPELFDTTMKKAKTGWTANAKDGVVAMNILKEKLIDKEQRYSNLNVQGKNVQVNMSFKPKWMKK